MTFIVTAQLGDRENVKVNARTADSVTSVLALVYEFQDQGGKAIYICDETRAYTIEELEKMKDAYPRP
jgi:hypothetical protein